MIFQIKSSLSESGFEPEEIDKFAFFADDLLYLTADHSVAKNMAGKYEAHLLAIMQTFKDRYLEVAHNFPSLVLEFYLVTRGDNSNLNTAARAAEERLRATVEKHRGSKNTSNGFVFSAVGTESLLGFARRRRQRSRLLKWGQQPLPVENGYVGMVKLPDYHSFLQNDTGGLDELIFESNVRGNQGRTSVNRQMRETLDKGGPPDFWQLNNGVTVTCSSIDHVDAWSLQVQDAQVVNGLQTSRQIFGHISERNVRAKEDKTRQNQDTRSVLMKLIPVSDDALRDRIIRATNNQNPMRASALRATDDLHRDIEDLFKQYNLFYDRRPGFYKDQEKPIRSIISLNEIVQAVVSLVLHRPDDARARPGDYVREGKKGDEKYHRIFSAGRSRHAIPLGAYLKCVLITRTVGEFLQGQQGLSPGDRHNLVFYVAFYLVCEMTQAVAPTAEEILRLGSITNSRLLSSWAAVHVPYQALAAKEDGNYDVVAKSTALLDALNKGLIERFGTRFPPKGRTLTSKKVRDVLKESDDALGQQ